MNAEQLIDSWRARGTVLELTEHVFVVDVPPAEDAVGPPVLVLHGFPTSSIDFHGVVDLLAARRRVVLLDLPGYGLSAKVDRAYSLFEQADVVEAVAGELGLTEVDLLTHDMGDSVGGEVLARSLDGTLPFAIRRRVLTNGSIYLGLAQLTDGQKFLSALPDEALDDEVAPTAEMLTFSLTATLAPGAEPTPEVVAAALAIAEGGGNRLLPRLIRYLDERRQHEHRWTGAIETHPAPLHVVWGDQDPIAVWAMTDQLLERRADATRVRLEGVGHYPMVEAPERFVAAVLEGLDPIS